jgi:hypothetical protein
MLPIVVILALQAPSPAPAGHYVESRTAAVYAGACHYNGEYCTEGREALCVWQFDEGFYGGVDLRGAAVALALRADANLAAPEAHIRRAVYLSSDGAGAAALELLRAREPELFRGATLLDTLPIRARFGADGSYSVDGGQLFALSGGTLADRACCKMPFNVWYAPFATISGRVVGDNQVFRMSDTRLGRVFERPGENAAITGAFRFAD